MALPRNSDPVSALPRALRLLWGRPEPGRRGPKPALTLTEIAEQGVRVADAEGLPAASMGRLAKDLGVSTMALYRYVDAKADLHLAMAEVAYGRPGEMWPSRWGWRRCLEDWARSNRAILLAHPWLLHVPLDGPPVLPSTLQWMDRGLAALADTGLGEQDKLSSLLLVEMYVRGHVQLAHQGVGFETSGSADPHAYAAALRALTDAPEYAHVRRAVASGALEDDDEGLDEVFDFALRVVLDGIESRFPRRPRTRA